jgi:hypothetical protein
MKLSEILRHCASAAVLSAAATASALPIHFDLAATEQWHTATGKVASAVYGVSATFDSDSTGNLRAGSTSIFMATSFGEARAGSTDPFATPGTRLTSRAHGFGDTDARATGGGLSAWASTSSLASGFGEAFAFPGMDLLADLSVRSTATVRGHGDSRASFLDGMLSASSGTKSSGTGTGAASIVTRDDVLVQSKAPVLASTASSAFAQVAFDWLRSDSNGALASVLGLGETLAPFDEDLVLRKHRIGSRTDSETDTLARALGHELGSHADGRVLVDALAEVLAQVSETELGSNSNGIARAIGYSDSFVSWGSDYRALTGGARAGYLIAISERDLAALASPENLSAAASAVGAMAFGYTEAWVERIAEPGMLFLFAAGTAALGLCQVRRCAISRRNPDYAASRLIRATDTSSGLHFLSDDGGDA